MHLSRRNIVRVCIGRRDGIEIGRDEFVILGVCRVFVMFVFVFGDTFGFMGLLMEILMGFWIRL